MTYLFSALRFIEDENISEKIYWYRSPFPVKAGDTVLAPVGSHNGIQLARVERVMTAEKENAPYDFNTIKTVRAKVGARRLNFLENCHDLGGVRYDQKHFTRYGVFLRAIFPHNLNVAQTARMQQYGVTTLINLSEDGRKAADGDFRIINCPMEEGRVIPYTQMLDSVGALAALHALAVAKGCSLFGCETGKEKSGVLAAILLLLADVPERAVKEDFVRVFSLAENAKAVDKRRIDEFFREIRACGGAQHFLLELGLSREEIGTLKGKLQ